MLRRLFTNTFVLAIAEQAVSVVPSLPSTSQTETPTNSNTGSSHLSTEAIISIISVLVTIIIGIVTLVVTIFGIALAWWQWKTSRGRSRCSSSTTSDSASPDHPMYGHPLTPSQPTFVWTHTPSNAERVPQHGQYFQVQYECVTMRSSTP